MKTQVFRYIAACTLISIIILLSSCKSSPSSITKSPAITTNVVSNITPSLTSTPRKTPSTDTIPTEAKDEYIERRMNMVEYTISARGVENEDVLRAMQHVPRHFFVPNKFLDDAYADHPLPIGYGQTISQPFIVAWMTELLELKPGEKVLEIGTGSGYQAAVLAYLEYVDVYSVEIIPELADLAASRIKSLGYENVHIKQDDGYYGWEEHAPFDAIIVTAAPDHLPQPLIKQLKIGGRLVIPIGPPGGYQTLWQFVKHDEEQILAHNLGGVAFVPFTGGGIMSAQETMPSEIE